VCPFYNIGASAHPMVTFSGFNSLTPMAMGSAPHRIPTVGIVRKVPSTRTQLSHKHHHHGDAVCPSYGVLTMDTPDRTRATSSEGVGKEQYGLD
jgi:hypothetical protein